jgi:hypothetical protein
VYCNRLPRQLDGSLEAVAGRVRNVG